jgi:xanthine dehydrogenase accessory factor
MTSTRDLPTELAPRPAPPSEVLREVVAALDRGERVAVATVLARHGSAPSTPGQKLALTERGVALGTVGGGAVELAVLAALGRALGDPDARPVVDTFRLGPSLGMCCGGSVELLVEPLAPALPALVVGAGHVGAALAPLLASLGFRVLVVDARDEVVASPALLAARPLGPDHVGAPTVGAPTFLRATHDEPEVLRALGVERGRAGHALCLVMTHDHQLDQQVIEWALGVGFGFVGGVGSRAKAAKTRARLEHRGVASELCARVRMPLGLDVGARTPGEIAVAIAAELVLVRSGRDQSPRAPFGPRQHREP